ncbi:hypothetical protein C8F01DRAFT_1105586 [Mycena amicta]|nr:hypothetical protein C8F01DRAFT_1105586 [Mycena amicta]
MSQQRRSALDILPPELWEAVFIRVHISEYLLGLAKVCVAFSELCVRAFLKREGIPLQDLIHGRVTLSYSLLRVLALYSRSHILPATRIECVVDSVGTGMFLLDCLDRILQRSPQLQRMTVSFGMNLFWIPAVNQGEIAHVFRSLAALLSRMAMRLSGPVVVQSPTTGFTCRPLDIAAWELHRFRFNPRPESWIKRLMSPEDGAGWDIQPPPLSVETRLHNGGYVTVRPLAEVVSFDLQLVVDAPQPVSLLVFNAANIILMSLKSKLPLYEPVLLHARFPVLRKLSVHSSFVDPHALHRFLVNHPLLAALELLDDSERVQRPLMINSDTLVDPPLAHPGLKEVRAAARSYGFGSLLSALGTSPALEDIIFSVEPFPSPSQTAALIRELRVLSSRQLPDGGLALHLLLGGSGSESARRVPTGSWAQNPDVLSLASQTHCVQVVHITQSSVDTARTMLPWLAAFPALDEVQIWIRLRSQVLQKQISEQEKKAEERKLLAEARGQLTGVPAVLCTVF